MCHWTPSVSTLLGQRPLRVLPVRSRLLATVRLHHHQEEGRRSLVYVPGFMSGAGGKVNSDDDWNSTFALLEMIICMLFVADVIKSFDAVDGGGKRSISDSGPGRLGLPASVTILGVTVEACCWPWLGVDQRRGHSQGCS